MPVKALSPNCRGGSFTGRRQTAATPHAPPSEKAAGIRTEPTAARPPHSCKRLTRMRSAVRTPNGAGIGAGHVTSSSPGFVQVPGSASGPALAGRSVQKRSKYQNQRRRTAGPSRRSEQDIPGRRPRHRECHFSAGGAERKLAYRASQNHARAQSGAKPLQHPTPQNRSFPPTIGRPCAAKTIKKQDWQGAQRADSARSIPMRQ